jgi:hypothetical protein
MTVQTLPPTLDAVEYSRRLLQCNDSRAAESTADLLCRVSEWEYVISPEAIDAVQLLANPTGPGVPSGFAGMAAQLGRGQRLEKEVAEFAKCFFDFTPDERAQRWMTLSDACRGIPALSQWLFDLVPGLETDGYPASDDDLVNELVKACREVFVLPHPAGARRRQEFIAMCRQDATAWEDAALQLQINHPQFIGAIATWVNPLTRLVATERELEQGVPISMIQPAAGFDRPGGNRQTAPRGASDGSRWWIVAAVIVGARILAAMSNAPHSPPPRDRSRPSYPIAQPKMFPYQQPNQQLQPLPEPLLKALQHAQQKTSAAPKNENQLPDRPIELRLHDPNRSKRTE